VKAWNRKERIWSFETNGNSEEVEKVLKLEGLNNFISPEGKLWIMIKALHTYETTEDEIVLKINKCSLKKFRMENLLETPRMNVPISYNVLVRAKTSNIDNRFRIYAGAYKTEFLKLGVPNAWLVENHGPFRLSPTDKIVIVVENVESGSIQFDYVTLEKAIISGVGVQPLALAPLKKTSTKLTT
jgi:hypothetical protein